MLDVLSRPVPGEPYPAPTPPPGGYLDVTRRPDHALPRRLRIGQFTEPIMSDAAVHPECAAAVDRTVDALLAAGHDVVEVKVPVSRPVAAALDVVLAALVAAVPVPEPREPLLREYTRRWRSRGAGTSAVALVQAVTTLQHAAAAAAAQLTHLDLLLCPTVATPYLPVDRGCDCPDRPTVPAIRPRDREISPYCAWFNVSGAPAVSLPVYSTADGVPVGVMLGGVALTGPDNVDARLLAVAAEVERALPWLDRHPAAWCLSEGETGCRRYTPPE
jgi:amidase